MGKEMEIVNPNQMTGLVLEGWRRVVVDERHFLAYRLAQGLDLGWRWEVELSCGYNGVYTAWCPWRPVLRERAEALADMLQAMRHQLDQWLEHTPDPYWNLRQIRELLTRLQDGLFGFVEPPELPEVA